MTRKQNDKAERSWTNMRCSCRSTYLLRLWSAGELGGINWQASLEDPKTGERIGFASLEELFAYLMGLTSAGFGSKDKLKAIKE